MKNLIFIFLLLAGCATLPAGAQTQIDLSKQKGIVPVVNGGTGTSGQLSVSTQPNVIQFGAVKTASSSVAQNVAISNTGTNPVVVSSVLLSGTGAAHFSTSNICVGAANAIPGGATCVEQVQYNPVSAIAEVAMLTVATNAPVDAQNPLTVALSGTGTAAVTYTLSVNGPGTGSGTVVSNEPTPLINCTLAPPNPPAGQCSNSYASGATPVLTATPFGGNTFSSFSGGGCSTSPCPVSMIAATTVSATFVVIPQTVTVNILGGGQGTGNVVTDVSVNGGGILNCNSTAGVLTSGGNSGCTGTVNKGTVITFTESVSGSNTFTSWIGGPVACTNTSTCVVTANSNVAITANFAPPPSGTALALVQGINKGQVASANSIAQVFSQAQSAGDTILVKASWGNNTTTVTSVTDTKGNSYGQVAVVSPQTQAGQTAVLYCATNIAAAGAGANTLTIALSASIGNVDLTAVEYAGVSSCTPDDKNVGKNTTGTAMDSGAVTTTQANDLLVGFNSVGSLVNLSGPSNGQTWSTAIARTSFGNDVEQIVGVPAGTYHDLPSQTTSGIWISQIVAMKSQTVTANSYSLTIQCAGSGNATITSSFGTPSINASCAAGVPGGTYSVAIPAGQSGNINVTPLTGSSFVTMAGGGCSTNASCLTNSITANTTITVTVNNNSTLAYYVSCAACTPAGDDARTALQAQNSSTPWATINHADANIALGSSGTTVHINACPSSTPCYTGFVTTSASGTATQRITYVSDTKWAAIFKQSTFGTSQPTWTMTGAFSTIQNIDASSSGSQIINVQCANCWIIGNHIHDNISYVDPGDYSYNASDPSCANSAAGIVVDSGHEHDDVLISGNVVHDIGWSLPIASIPAGHPNAGSPTPNPVNCNFSVGIYQSARSTTVNNIVYRVLVNGIIWNHFPTDPVISNNLIFNISKPGQANGKGLSMQNSAGGTISNAVIQNNIVRDVSGPGLALLCFGGIGTNDFVRNNLFFSYTTLSSGCPAGVSFTNNKTGVDPLMVNYNANPAVPTIVGGLVNFSNADYHLQSTSPAINTGTSACAAGGLTGCVPLVDLDGIARPQGSNFDIGPYESTAPVSQNNYYVSPSGSDSNSGSQGSPWQTFAKANSSAVLGANGTIIHFADGTYVGSTSTSCGALGNCSFAITSGGSATQQLIYQCDNGLNGNAGHPGVPGHCLLRESSDTANAEIIGTAGASYVTIQGFDIGGDGGHPATTVASPVTMNAKDGTALFMSVSHNYIHDTTSATADTGFGVGCPSTGMVAYNSGFPFTAGRNPTDGTFVGNWIDRGGNISNTACNQFHGLYIGAGPRMTVESNIVGNTPGSGIKLYGSNCSGVVANNLVYHTGWWGILVDDTGNGACAAQGASIGLSSINNNIIVDTGFNAALGAIAENSGSGTNLYATNLLIGNQTNQNVPIVNNSSTPIPSPSIVSGTLNNANSGATTANTFNNYSDLPTSSTDFTLKAGSVALSAASNSCIAGGVSPCVPSIDIRGVVRPQGGASDIGPYEQ